MFVLIDNYDSFTYNLWHYLGELGADVTVVRNDARTVDEIMAMAPEGIILSPGPCDPDRAGVCLELIARATGRLPVLGVCLGHQAIGQSFGGRVIRAPQPVHGKTSAIHHDGTGLFRGIPSPFQATRYHSLVVERAALPDCLEVNAWTDDGLVMGLNHRMFDIMGVQFHPESIASEHGHRMLGNFLAIARRQSGAAAQ
ncbi:MAG: aminodeoxychorismate/anthranilate synthase component II [Telmatospirillum sp.]|nr:aminodeoxychorismate/anthranilate synthase component II [Telmatospirillum sp.]